MLGGAGQHAVVLGNALIDAGHEVHLLGYRNPAAAGEDNGFRGPLHRLIDFRGARWHEDAFGAFLPMARPHMARRLWQAISSLAGPWDVVHYHGHNPILGTLVPASWNFVHTLHDQGAECITKTRFKVGEVCREREPAACAGCACAQPNAAQRWLSAQAVQGLRRASLASFQRHKAIFVSEFLRQRFCDLQDVAASSIRAEVLHNFIDPGRLPATSREFQQEGSSRMTVFASGRIDASKGFAPWLDAIPDAALQTMRIVIAGDGPDLAALRQRHQGRGIEFLGWCSKAQVLSQLQSADISVVPSVWDEPCATTVLEALALGRTVLALHRGGTPELTSYGEPGQLCLFNSSQELAAATVLARRCIWPANARAAVQSRLPRLLAVYREGLSARQVQEVAA